MKKKYISVVLTMLFLSMAVLSTTGCLDNVPTATSTPASSGPIAGAVTALSLDSATLKPLKTTSVFKKDTPIIYCSVAVANTTEEIVVSAEWLLVEGANNEVDIKKHSAAITTDGPRYVSFAWMRQGDTWIVGDYKVVISVDGKEAVTVPFRIE
ncbi:MAG TPA: hypothetical protein DCX22_00620 [Dehalococcoidia bacterium]|nr:hypothetical protein [Dehalococcoidia bacterium]